MEHIKDILCPDCNENTVDENRMKLYGKCRTCQRREILCKTKGVKYVKFKDLPQKEKDRLQRVRKTQLKWLENKKVAVEKTPFGEPIPDIKMRHSPNQIYTPDMVKYLLKIADGTQTAIELKEMLCAEYPNKDINGHNLNNILSRYNIPYVKRAIGKRKIKSNEQEEIISDQEQTNFDSKSYEQSLDERVTELIIGDNYELPELTYEQISADYCNLLNNTPDEPERFAPIKLEVEQVLDARYKQSNCNLEKTYTIDDYINMLEMLYYLSGNVDNIMQSRIAQYSITNKYQDDILHAIEIEIADVGDTYLTDKLHILRKIRRNCESDKDAVYRMQPFLKSLDRNLLKIALGNLKRYQLVKDSIKFIPAVDTRMIEQYNWAVDEIPMALLNEQHTAQVNDYMKTTFGVDNSKTINTTSSVKSAKVTTVDTTVNVVKQPTNDTTKKKSEKKTFNFRVSCKISGGGYGAFAHWHHDYSCVKPETALAYATNTLNQMKQNKGIMWQDLDIVPLNNTTNESTIEIPEKFLTPKELPAPAQPVKLVDKQVAASMDKEVIEFKTRCVTTKYLEDTTSGANLKRFRVTCDVNCAGFDKPRVWKKIYMCSEPELAVKDAQEMLTDLQYKYPNTTIGEIRIEQL